MSSFITSTPVIENINQLNDSIIYLTSLDETKLLMSRNLDFISLISNKDQILIESKEVLEDFLNDNDKIKKFLIKNFNSLIPLDTFLSDNPSSIILIKK